MAALPIIHAESERLRLLERLKLLDSPPELVFDSITRLTADVLEVPIALLTFVDKERQWFKSQVGLGVRETPRIHSFCAHTIPLDGPLIIEDALNDGRFCNNPLVTAEPSIRFYAGVPIHSARGFVIATLCVIDRLPRDFTARELRLLEQFAGLMQQELRHREAMLDAQAVVTESLSSIASIESRFRATFEHAAVGMALVGTDGSWLRVNPKLCDILDYSAEELLGRTFQEITYPDDLDNDLELMQRVLARELETYAIEKRYIRKDGRVVWANLTCTLTFRPDGKADHFIAVVEQIDGRKHAEAQLHAALDEARNANLANLAKSAFLANMSHEIRTPVSTILGVTQLLMRGAVDAEQRRLLRNQLAAGNHLLSVINDILDISRVEAGKLELSEQRVDCRQIVDNVAAMVEESLRARQVTLSIELQPLPADLLGDEARLQQALLNYVANAAKFTHAGTIQIAVQLLEEDDDGALLRFEVRDTGIGIAPAALERLFNAFTQADAETIRKYGGSGLGLAITQRLATLMGGTTGAESASGSGSTFWFTARLRKGVPQVAATPAPESSSEERLRAVAPGMRILVVDDVPFLQQYSSLLLKAVGCDTTLAGDGAEALMLASSVPFDAILMDVQMPVMDGLEATIRIRLLPGYQQTPIIALTANALTDERDASLAAGVTDYLTKPVQAELLFATLLKWLQPCRQEE
jgi:two-component system sensor histidine kinase/response regulator